MQKFKQGDRVRFNPSGDATYRLHWRARTIRGELGTVTVGSYYSNLPGTLQILFVRVKWDSDEQAQTYYQNFLEHAPVSVNEILEAVCDAMVKT